MRAAPMRAWRRGVGGLRHPTRPGTGRTPHPPKGSQAHVRTKQPPREPLIPQTRLPQTLSAGVRRGLTEIIIVRISLGLCGISRNHTAQCRVTDYAIKRLTPPRSQSQRRRRSRNLDSIRRIRVRASCSTSPIYIVRSGPFPLRSALLKPRERTPRSTLSASPE
jgi:hypothetical protein